MKYDLEARSYSAAGWYRRIGLLAGPIIISNLSVPLLGLVDTAVVGHLPDPAYIGGVALGALIFDFVFWGFGFLRMGTTGFTAQAMGARDAPELQATLLRALALSVGIGLCLVALQIPIALLAFKLLGASSEVEGFASAYLAIRIWAAPAALINFSLLGWFLGRRQPALTMTLQLVMNGLNIVLDLVFVWGFGWGVEGVAWATLIAEATTAVLGLLLAWRAFRREGRQWNWPRIWDRERLAALLRVNGSILIRSVCLVFAFSYFTARGAAMGDLVLAANAVLMHFFYIAAYGLDGFAHAIEVLAGNAVGARSRRAFRAAVKAAAVLTFLVVVPITVLYALTGPLLIALITDIEEVRQTAGDYLPWAVALPLVSVWAFLLDGVFIGATRSRAMRNAMVVSVLLFLAVCWILVPAFGNHGLWAAFTVFMILRALTLAACYPSLERAVESGEAVLAK